MDPFHKEYRALTDEEKALMAEIKDAAFKLYTLYGMVAPGGSRETSVAKTELENSVMWAIKGLTA